jgi:hypothetical protein
MLVTLVPSESIGIRCKKAGPEDGLRSYCFLLWGRGSMCLFREADKSFGCFDRQLAAGDVPAAEPEPTRYAHGAFWVFRAAL